MNIGKLNRRVEILQYLVERDEYGGEDGKWLVVDKKWAKIEPISGTEVFTAQQVTAENVVKITTRYDQDITVIDRIGYGEKAYEIIGVIDSHTNHRLTILNCKELISDGLYGKTKESQGQN